MSGHAGQRSDWALEAGRIIKPLAFATLYLALVLLALQGGSWAMPGQTPTHQTLPPVGSIAGKVFLDTNGSGGIDAGEEGIPGVRLLLDRGVASTLSEPDGDYWFPNLVAGSTHSVSAIRPAGLHPTTDEEVSVDMPGSTLPVGPGVELFFGYQHRLYMPVLLLRYTLPVPDLSTSIKSVDKDQASAGETLRYSIELHSTGGRAAEGSLRDPIPAGTTFVAGSLQGGVYSPGQNQVEWSGTLTPGSSHVVVFDVLLSQWLSDQVLNRATIGDGFHASFDRTAVTRPRVTNSGFETGDFSGWQQDGELDRSVSSTVTHSGNYAALLGDPNYECRKDGVPVGSAWMEQANVPVPVGGMPSLSFWYRIYTEDHLTWTNGTLGDSFDVYVNGNRVLRDNYDNFPLGAPGCDRTKDLGWKFFSYDLTAFAGQTITLRFEDVSRIDGWYNTWTYVDEVEIRP